MSSTQSRWGTLFRSFSLLYVAFIVCLVQLNWLYEDRGFLELAAQAIGIGVAVVLPAGLLLWGFVRGDSEIRKVIGATFFTQLAVVAGVVAVAS